jgi:hypothetical protein
MSRYIRCGVVEPHEVKSSTERKRRTPPAAATFGFCRLGIRPAKRREGKKKKRDSGTAYFLLVLAPASVLGLKRAVVASRKYEQNCKAPTMERESPRDAPIIGAPG